MWRRVLDNFDIWGPPTHTVTTLANGGKLMSKRRDAGGRPRDMPEPVKAEEARSIFEMLWPGGGAIEDGGSGPRD